MLCTGNLQDIPWKWVPVQEALLFTNNEIYKFHYYTPYKAAQRPVDQINERGSFCGIYQKMVLDEKILSQRERKFIKYNLFRQTRGLLLHIVINSTKLRIGHRETWSFRSPILT